MLNPCERKTDYPVSGVDSETQGIASQEHGGASAEICSNPKNGLATPSLCNSGLSGLFFHIREVLSESDHPERASALRALTEIEEWGKDA